MIIVTGASKGLGYSIAEALIHQGKQVIGVSRSKSNLKIEQFLCDVSSYENIKDLSLVLKKRKVSIDAIINSAGIASMNLAVTTPIKTTKSLINTNLLGTIFCCQLLSPLMMRKRKGKIINFSTIAVHLGLKGESIYAASKAGVEGFSKSFAREMADFNISVNCIAPGPIKTDLIKGVSQNKIDNIISQQIIQKQFQKSDVCDLVDMLLDERSSSLSGQVLHIGGV